MNQTFAARLGFQDPDLKSPEHDRLMIELAKRVEGNNLLKNVQNCTVKFEVPIFSDRQHKFMIGFADAVVSFDQPSTWEGKDILVPRALGIEIKPKVMSFGETLRQINLYRQYLEVNYWALVLSEASSFEEMFEKENISTFVFKKKPDEPS